MKKRLLSLITAMSIISGTAGFAAESDGIYGWSPSADGGCLCEAYDGAYVGGKRCAHLAVGAAGGTARLETAAALCEGAVYVIDFWARSSGSNSFSLSVGDAGFNLLSAMKSYDWTNFRYEYTHKAPQPAQLAFELAGGGDAYIDNVCVYEKGDKRRRNVIVNGGFEQSRTQESTADNAVISEEEFMASAAEKTAMPIEYRSDIKVDADLSEWEGAEIRLPSENGTAISDYGGQKDASAVVRCAYDEEFLYISARVTDDVHCQPNDGSGYWRGDSIQLAISTPDEDYGTEIGFYLTDSGEAKVYSAELEKTEWGAQDPKVLRLREKTACSARRSDGCTYYEMAVPWELKFEGKPDEFLLNILINDNDGSGRRGYIEWREGIGKTKSNEKFTVMLPVQNPDGVYAYIDGRKSILEQTGEKYELYIVNGSDTDRKITVKTAQGGEIMLAAHSVCVQQITAAAETAGEMTVAAELECGGRQIFASRKIGVKRNLALAFEQFRATGLEELYKLREKCTEQNLRTDYEDITITTIENFIDYGLEDYNGGRASRAQYVYDCLEKLYTEAKQSLTAYTDGTRQPKQAVYYQSGKAEISGKAFYADVKNAATGEVRRAPVFLSGYLDATRASDDIAKYGANMLQFEVPMSGYMGGADTVRGWRMNKAGGADAQYSYDKTAYKGSYSLKISNRSAKQSNVYTNLSQNVTLKGGRKYKLSFWARAESAQGCYLRPNGWKGEKISLSGSYDWKKLTYEYAPEEDITAELMFMSEDLTGGLYLDDIRLCEKGDDTNLVRQGGFEELPVIINGYSVDVDRFRREVLAALDEAERNNVAVDVLMSVHYFPEKLMDKEHWQSNQTGFVKHNLFDDEVQKLCEAFFSGLVPLMANHPALSSICISNEPTYRTGLDASNTEEWHRYLRGLYGDISHANNIWHENYADFADVPLVNEYENRAVYYDYLRFNDMMFARWHKRIAELVKELAPGVPVHSKMMSVVEQAETSGKNYPLERGTNPELFAKFCDLNGNDSWNFIGSSRNMTVKSMWYDLLTSMHNAPVFNSEDHVVEDRDERYTEQYAPHFATDLWQGAIHGRSAMTMWKWARTLETTNSTSGNIKHRPDAVALEGHTMLDLNRLAGEVAALQNTAPSAAIFYSYPSRVYTKTHMNAVYKCYEALGAMGLCAKFVTEKTVAEGALSDMPLLIVPCVESIDSQTLSRLCEYVRGGGRIITVGNCFLYDEHKNPLGDGADYLLAAARNIAVQVDEAGTHILPEERLCDVFGEYAAPVFSVIDCETGLALADAEWRCAEYNGTYLVNVCLFERGGRRRIKLVKNGVPAEGMTELRNGSELPGEFYINGYEPMLIKIGKGT